MHNRRNFLGGILAMLAAPALKSMPDLPGDFVAGDPRFVLPPIQRLVVTHKLLGNVDGQQRWLHIYTYGHQNEVG